MFCEIHLNAPQRRFVSRMWIAAGLCALFSVAAGLGFRLLHLHGVIAYLVAVLPALPVAGALLATGAYLHEETDEFQRNLLVQSVMGGIGATLAATTAWGYLEDFARAPHVSLAWVYPLFWVCVGLSFPLVWLRYR
jgi:tellurite resistance protein TehA-like permease